jgi:hypothetical protein
MCARSVVEKVSELVCAVGQALEQQVRLGDGDVVGVHAEVGGRRGRTAG